MPLLLLFLRCSAPINFLHVPMLSEVSCHNCVSIAKRQIQPEPWPMAVLFCLLWMCKWQLHQDLVSSYDGERKSHKLKRYGTIHSLCLLESMQDSVSKEKGSYLRGKGPACAVINKSMGEWLHIGKSEDQSQLFHQNDSPLSPLLANKLWNPCNSSSISKSSLRPLYTLEPQRTGAAKWKENLVAQVLFTVSL